MTLAEDRDRWVALVGAAQQGDASAWPAIIDRFEDIAVGSAVGLCGDLDDARDIAQEAFVLAFRHLHDLRDPAAFPAWFLRLIRTATNRRTRRRGGATVPLDVASRGDESGALVDLAPGPEEVALATAEAAEVRAAVEGLPEGERCVVALHHLAGMPYAEVADFLGITTSAAKKRAWSARARLKELLPMVADALAAARPSRSESFRDTILVFQALRDRDADGLARLLARDPTLATATEDWSPVEGFESRLGFSDRATALIRAAGIGDLRLVRLLVEAGAPVADACPCANHESALFAAVNIGAADVVDYLLDHGASVDGGAFDGETTALHVAVYHERHDLVRRLLAAGADPAATDAHGRTAADWGALKAPAVRVARRQVLWTRIRAIDLFAPLRRGALVYIPPAYGLGVIRTVLGIVDALAPARWWVIGFEHGPYESVELLRDARERDMTATVELIGPGEPGERRGDLRTVSSGWPRRPAPRSSCACPHPGTSTTSLSAFLASQRILRCWRRSCWPRTRLHLLRFPRHSPRASMRASPLTRRVSGLSVCLRSIQTAQVPVPTRTNATNTSPAPRVPLSPTTPRLTPRSLSQTRPSLTTRPRPSEPRRSSAISPTRSVLLSCSPGCRRLRRRSQRSWTRSKNCSEPELQPHRRNPAIGDTPERCSGSTLWGTRRRRSVRLRLMA